MKIIARYMDTTKREDLDISDCFAVEFDEGDGTIQIIVRDGKLEIRGTHKGLRIMPGASNLITIEPAEH